MLIEWCQEHKSSGSFYMPSSNGLGVTVDQRRCAHAEIFSGGPCLMVEMRLTPKDATVGELIGELERLGAFSAHHVFEVSKRSIAVQHPLGCRINGKSLLDCKEGNAVLRLRTQPAPSGRYVADFDGTRFSNWQPA